MGDDDYRQVYEYAWFKTAQTMKLDVNGEITRREKNIMQMLHVSDDKYVNNGN